jgi:hypothetical protein
MNIERLKTGLWFLLIASLFGGLISLIYTHREITPPPKNTVWCAEVIYFNPKSKTIDTLYTPAVLYDDSIVNFKSPSGEIWKAKDFIFQENKEVEYGTMSDLTVSNGEHFKVTPISDTVCLIKSKMDSLKSDNEPDDNDN